MTFDIYGDRAVEAMALIREFARVEYWDYFKGDPERALKVFCVMQDAAEAKSAARIAELEARLKVEEHEASEDAKALQEAGRVRVTLEVRIADLERQAAAASLKWLTDTVPKGWKLVPLEPTEAMLRPDGFSGRLRYDQYKAMLAAAPQAAEQTSHENHN